MNINYVTEQIKTADGSIIGASPIYINMLTTEPSAVGQGTWIRGVFDVQLFCGVFFNNPANNGDNFSVAFSCAGGKYKIDFNALKANGRGIIDVHIDNVEVAAGIDLYAASADALHIASIPDVEILSGDHILRFTVSGKNTSSTDFIISFQGISLTRTGDIS